MNGGGFACWYLAVDAERSYNVERLSGAFDADYSTQSFSIQRGAN